MKRLSVISLILATLLTILTGCGENGESSDLNIYSEASYDNESKFVPSEESKGNEISDEEAFTGEFVVKDKKYTFEGNNLVIVSVENQTNKNYSVTVEGTYLDKDGNVLKTETQTFDQYSAGYSGYFLFKPNMQFDKFTYKFETENADGPFYVKDITPKFNELREFPCAIDEEMAQGNYTRYPTIIASFSMAYAGSTTVCAIITWCLVKENGEIIAILDNSHWLYPKDTTERTFQSKVLQTKDDKIQWPDGWRGEIHAICVVTKVFTES